MILEPLVLAGVFAAAELLINWVGSLIDRWGRQEMPETVQAEMSATDEEKIEATQELIKECFGENVVETLRNTSNKDRISLMAEFAEKLVAEYGLDIEVDVTVNNVQSCGSYNWENKKAVFNIALLAMEGNEEHFEYCVRETLDTIIHELRHAVQHRSIEQGGFWNIDDERRSAWANNMCPGNYIRPEVDMRGYANQPLERDASTFAALVMKGVC